MPIEGETGDVSAMMPKGSQLGEEAEVLLGLVLVSCLEGTGPTTLMSMRTV